MPAGRIPEPTSKQKLKGTYRPTRRKGEPVSDGRTPEVPDFLDDTALAEWERVVDILVANGTLGRTDRGVLAGNCQSWSDYISAVELLRREGMVVVTSSGYSQPHPMVAIMNGAWDRYLKTSRELGLTPASRTKLDVRQVDTKTTGRLKYIGTG